MNIRKIKTLFPAPESSVSFYLTSTVASVAADASGAVVNKDQLITITEWKREGMSSAVVSAELKMTLSVVVNGVKQTFGQSNWAPQAQFLASVLNGQDSLLAELWDSSQHVVYSLSVPVIKKGQTGAPGDDGEDGVSYEITPSVSCISMDGDGKVKTGAITINAYRIKGSVRSELISAIPQHVIAGSDSWMAQYCRDGGDWTFFSTKMNISSGELSYEVPASAVQSTTSGLAFRLVYGKTSSYMVMHETSPIPVIRDGATGKQGKTGKWYYFAGYWKDGDTYTSSERDAPYVAYEYEEEQNGMTVLVERCYMLVAETNVVDGTPVAPRSTQADRIWEEMAQSFLYLITQAFFTKFAKLGSAVFSGDWMISQHGSLTHDITDVDKINLSAALEVFTVAELASMYLSDGTYDTWSIEDQFPDMTESEMTALIDICLWAQENGISASELKTAGSNSYQLFGKNSDDVMSVFRPEIAIDFSTGVVYLSNVEAYGFVGKQERIITKTNMSKYVDTYNGISYVSLAKAGTHLSFEGSGFSPSVMLPSLSRNYGSRYHIPSVRKLVGTTVIIYCRATGNLSLDTLLFNDDGTIQRGTVLYYGYMISMTCTVQTDSNGYEEIGWTYKASKYIN